MKDQDWDRVYAEADRRIELLLRSGVTVIDASRNFTKLERDRAHQVVKRSKARLVTIFVDTPESIARQRRLTNRTTQSRHDITDDEFDEIVRVMQPPTADEAALTFRHDEDIARWLQRNSRALDDRP